MSHNVSRELFSKILTTPQITRDHLVLAMRMRVELHNTAELTRALIIDELMERGLSEENAAVIEQMSKILHQSREWALSKQELN